MTNFCWFKKNKVWLWTVVDSHRAGILKWTLGNRDLETFRHLWLMIRGWHGFLYITDGYPVYPCLINDGDHLVQKTAMTRVEGENSRLRHYLALYIVQLSAIPNHVLYFELRLNFSSTTSNINL